MYIAVTIPIGFHSAIETMSTPFTNFVLYCYLYSPENGSNVV